MPAVRMFINKFNGVVLIDDDHPLAVAQRLLDAEKAKAATEKKEPVVKEPAVEKAKEPTPEKKDTAK